MGLRNYSDSKFCSLLYYKIQIQISVANPTDVLRLVIFHSLVSDCTAKLQ